MSTPDRDARLSNRAKSDDRAGREDSERTITEDRQVMDAGRLEQFRQNFTAERLPRIPPIPGFHVCWLTTTNNSDPVYRRIDQGYTLIKMADVPGLQISAVKEGDYVGCVMIGEMIAAKIPEELYQMYMQEVHYTQPMQEEEKLKLTLDSIAAEARGRKADVIVEEGSAQLGGQALRRPRSFT